MVTRTVCTNAPTAGLIHSPTGSVIASQEKGYAGASRKAWGAKCRELHFANSYRDRMDTGSKRVFEGEKCKN